MMGDIRGLFRFLLFWACVGLVVTVTGAICLMVWIGQHVRFS